MNESSQTPAEKALNVDEKEETNHAKHPKRNRKKKQHEVVDVAEVVTVVAELKETIVSQQAQNDNESIVEPVQDNVVQVVDLEIESQDKSICLTQEEEICAQPDAEALAPAEEVLVVPTEEVVVPAPAEEVVVPAPAEEVVVAPAAEEVVVPAPAEEVVAPAEEVGMIEFLSQPELRLETAVESTTNKKEDDAKFTSLMENMRVPKKWWEFWK